MLVRADQARKRELGVILANPCIFARQEPKIMRNNDDFAESDTLLTPHQQ